MTHIELNRKFMKAFGLGDTGPLLLQKITITLSVDNFPVIDVRYINTKNIINGELEEVLKTFKLQEDTI